MGEAFLMGQGGKSEQSKTVTPNASGFTVNPDTGKTLSSVIINGDPELISTNIKSGINIFGLAGSYTAKRYAQGEYTMADGVVRVSGLAFQPSIIMIKSKNYPNTYSYSGIYNPYFQTIMGGVAPLSFGTSSSGMGAATPTIKADGFDFSYGYWSSTQSPYLWMAIE